MKITLGLFNHELSDSQVNEIMDDIVPKKYQKNPQYKALSVLLFNKILTITDSNEPNADLG